MERDRRREAMPPDDREVLAAELCLRGLVPSPAWEDPATALGAEGRGGAGVLSHEIVACLRMTPGLEEEHREAALSPGEEEECVRVGGLRGVTSRDARCRL